MSLRKPLLLLSLLILTVCLAAGLGSAGIWLGVLAAVLLVPAWLLAGRSTNLWLPFLCLLASLGLAVAGRLLGAAPALMIASTAVALAAWDLTGLDASLRKASFGEQTRRYEQNHIRSLLLALGLGLFGALLGRLIELHFPALLLMLLVVCALFALDRVWVSIK
jgi:hypothetical protein